MTKHEQEKVQKQLLGKLAELQGSTSRKDDLIAERLSDPMDQMQSRADLDLAVTTINTSFEMKRAVETALHVLEAGDYGVCRDCGEDINPKRLEAVPWTTLCIVCQEMDDLERQFAGDNSKPIRAAASRPR